MSDFDKPVPTNLQAIAPLLKEVYEGHLNEQLKRAAVLGKFEWTPEQEQRIKEQTAKREKERQELLDILATATGTVKAIVELHSTNKWDECQGCDFGGWEGEEPAWPCRTIELIAEELRK